MYLIKPSHIIETKLDYGEILCKIERSARTCYKSRDKMTSDTGIKLVRRLIEAGHHSVIEHENITVRFICDRGITHELVRHRLASYSQESTRYCNYRGGLTFVIPPWNAMFKDVVEPLGVDSLQMISDYIQHPTADEAWLVLMARAEESYKLLLNSGWSPQQARSVLPNSLKTEIVMTANLREWRHVLTLRCSRAAHPQMRELMIPLAEELKRLLPVFFEDIRVSRDTT